MIKVADVLREIQISFCLYSFLIFLLSHMFLFHKFFLESS